ncbi:hypothetical protein [Polynucleobacter necessarius]|uniref:hypothetical protein n=1 Tax=Polynucleobacter necessarius TaxID=576610 RepID=UPI000E094339|nr:hypothetical protein [Polynucleobacter necessarius]
MAHSLPTSPNNIRVSTDILDTHPILEGREVTSKVDGKISHCSIKALGMDDIDAVLNVQDETVRNIQDSSIFYYPDSREVFEVSLGNEGLIIGSLVNDRLVAFRSIWFPGLRPENLGRDIVVCKTPNNYLKLPISSVHAFCLSLLAIVCRCA